MIIRPLLSDFGADDELPVERGFPEDEAVLFFFPVDWRATDFLNSR